jgi:DNA repair exonuclease SbcCD ATPase subunit
VRIHRISIRNFRGVDSCEVALAPTGVTIIEGPNEIGKSSLAEAIDLLFEYPHDSRHRNVLAVRPVHRDVGTFVEVELTTGPYHLNYAKQWFRQPETRLVVDTPRPENLTARSAHDRMEAILAETLDRDLYRALRFVQGTKIDQGTVGNSVTLIGALDAAAAGGLADPNADATLWEAIEAERGRYFTPTGRVSLQREQLARELSLAQDRLEEAQSALSSLEELGDELRATTARLAQKEVEEREAMAQLADAERACQELDAVAQSVSEQTTEVERAEHAETNARHALETRQALVAALEEGRGELEHHDAKLARDAPLLEQAEAEEADAQRAYEAAEAQRAAALSAVEVADRDREFRRAEISLVLLDARVGRVQEARERETAARQVLEGSRVTRAARAAVEKAVQRLNEANAAIRAGSPVVEIEALAGIDVEVGDDSVRLEVGQRHEVSVPTSTTIGIGAVAKVRVRSGMPANELAEEAEQAERDLASLLERYGLDHDDPLGSLTTALEARRDAEREIEQAQRLRSDALEDLSEEQLAAKARNARSLVETYREQRPAEPPLPETAEAAEAARTAAVAALRAAESNEKELRSALEASRRRSQDLRRSVETSRELQRRALQRVQSVHEQLTDAREQASDAQLEEALQSATERANAARAARSATQRALDALDPDNTRLRRENAQKRLERVRKEQGALEDRRIELRTALREKGESDLQAEIDAASESVERLRIEHEDIERRAAAAQRLYETFARHRDAARLAYVAPYKAQVDRLARLVFGSDASVEIDPEDFSVVSRVLHGVAVPYESLSTGAREQIAVLARLACAILVNPDGAEGDVGVPVILDDALGYTDPERLRLVAPAFTAAAKQAQVIIMTSTPDRYAQVGDATVIQLPIF